MSRFGTVDFYESMAEILNNDLEWKDLGKGIDCSMIHAYAAPINKAFHMRFDGGQVGDVREVADPGAEGADYVLNASPDVWKRVFSKVPKARASAFHLALSTGQIRFTGPFMAAYLKQSKAWEHTLDLISINKLTEE